MKTRNSARGTLLAVLFLAAVVIVFTGCLTAGDAWVSSYYGSMYTPTGRQRPGPHAGIDVDAPYDAPALAAADGVVMAVINSSGCGNGVTLQHFIGEKTYYYTVYCHLNEVAVRSLQDVKRGGIIGKVGATGRSGGTPHVHFEVCTYLCYGHASGYLKGTLDPLPFIVGCFDPTENETYSAMAKSGGKPRLVLTYPVQCAPKKKKPS